MERKKVMKKQRRREGVGLQKIWLFVLLLPNRSMKSNGAPSQRFRRSTQNVGI
jgi:hypothetical protein